MAPAVYRVGRRELWRARLHGWRERLRRPDVWGLALAGLAIIVATGWWYTDRTAFAHRAVATTATVEQVYSPVRLEHEDGRPSLVVYGMLRYRADGRTIQTRVRLVTCSTGACVAASRNRQGHAVQIAYDPKRVTRVHVGRKVPTSVNSIMMVLIGIGVVLIGAGLYTLLFDLGIPAAKPRDGRPAT